ncbi:MAG: SUMF1/EgtB/PvdO family nonheme iron enzyme [Candidatus Eisenbacteria bacterium]
MRLLVFTAVATVALAITCSGNTVPMIMNVSVETAGDTIRITYDVDDPDGDRMTVLLRFAGADGGVDGPVTGIGGDMGTGVLSGTAKVIAIDLAVATGLPEPLVPRILAHDGIGLGGEMIAVASTGGPDFLVDKYETTNEQFAAFVLSDGYEFMDFWLVDDGTIEIVETGWNYAGKFQWLAPRFWDPSAEPPWSTDPNSGLASTPVLGMSWFEAYAYCKWAGRRLPSSGEWLEAAGLDVRAYSWGNERTGGAEPPWFTLANVRFGYEHYSFGGFTNDGSESAAPVGSHSPVGDSPLGIADAIGNAWEWCNDVVAVVDYGTFSCATRPLRGGSWATAMPELVDPVKDLCPLYRTETIGFRCFR